MMSILVSLLLLLQVPSSISLRVETIGSKSYFQCVDACKVGGDRLATKQEVLDYLGGAQGGDIWTPVSGYNEWLQIGGGIHQYGVLHAEIAGGGNPSWGVDGSTRDFKQSFYCAPSIELRVETIGSKSYSQCVDTCEATGGSLATKEEVLDYSGGGLGGDIWTPVAGSGDNNWLQIGGVSWTYGVLHTEIPSGGNPSWGLDGSTRDFKQSFYCAGECNGGWCKIGEICSEGVCVTTCDEFDIDGYLDTCSTDYKELVSTVEDIESFLEKRPLYVAHLNDQNQAAKESIPADFDRFGGDNYNKIGGTEEMKLFGLVFSKTDLLLFIMMVILYIAFSVAICIYYKNVHFDQNIAKYKHGKIENYSQSEIEN